MHIGLCDDVLIASKKGLKMVNALCSQSIVPPYLSVSALSTAISIKLRPSLPTGHTAHRDTLHQSACSLYDIFFGTGTNTELSHCDEVIKNMVDKGQQASGHWQHLKLL